MDPQAFDWLVRALAQPASRRRALQGVARVIVVGLGTTLNRAGAAPTTAAPIRTTCLHGRKRCGLKCVDLNSNPAHCGNCHTSCRPLGPGGRCCAGTCFDILGTDPNHCGACSAVCDATAVCTNGTCQPCPNGQTRCPATDGVDACVNLQTNEANCGHCGQVCGTGRQCCAGACVDVAVDVANCGACGVACDAIAQCCAGVCSFLDDLDHCGTCNVRCPAGTVGCDVACAPAPMCCLPGQNGCRAQDCGQFGCCDVPPVPNCNHCPAGTTCCDQFCVDLASDRTHCGSCGHACDNTAICASGGCVACPPGRVVCGNACCFP